MDAACEHGVDVRVDPPTESQDLLPLAAPFPFANVVRAQSEFPSGSLGTVEVNQSVVLDGLIPDQGVRRLAAGWDAILISLGKHHLLEDFRGELEQEAGKERKGVWCLRFGEQNLIDRSLFLDVDKVFEFVLSSQVHETVMPIKPVPGLGEGNVGFFRGGRCGGCWRTCRQRSTGTRVTRQDGGGS